MAKNNTVGFLGGKFLPFHLGHIYAIVAASNYVDELYVVLSSSKNRDREICERDGVKYIPAEIRLSWIGESLNNLENVKVIHVEDDQWDDDYDWEQGANMIKSAIGKSINYVFSSETSYDEHFKKYYPFAKHIVINEGRSVVPISATKMREEIYDNWDKLPSSVRSYFTKKIAIVGTESCGKSTLTKKLAKFYNTNYLHEIGRDYCEKYSNQLTRSMFDDIAMKHFLKQKELAKESDKLLFVDSDEVITQYYLDMYFEGEQSPLIEELIKKQDYDLVLYLEPDVDWVDDGFRFSGEAEVRKKNNLKLKKMYKDREIEFVTISGSYSERFDRSRQEIDKILRKLK